jgi:hypothetical protein
MLTLAIETVFHDAKCSCGCCESEKKDKRHASWPDAAWWGRKERSLALALLGRQLPGGDDGDRARAVVVSQPGCINKHKASTRDSSYNLHLCLCTYRFVSILLL